MRLIIWAVIEAPSSAEAYERMEPARDRPLKLGRVLAEWARPGLIRPLVGGQVVAEPGWRAGKGAISFGTCNAVMLNHQK